jgi:hypothetical protein
MEVPGPGSRRGVTLAEQLAASSNLRDLLKLRDDDEGGRIAAARRRRRTLLDVIRGADDDHAPAGPVPAAMSTGGATSAQGEKLVDTGEEEGGSVGERCCVCVARGKGAAFIPCGHTFCRACASELRAGRGRCPLCNAAIREVLNLF